MLVKFSNFTTEKKIPSSHAKINKLMKHILASDYSSETQKLKYSRITFAFIGGVGVLDHSTSPFNKSSTYDLITPEEALPSAVPWKTNS